MRETDLPAGLAETLEGAAEALAGVTDDWMVFGGSAMLLHGFAEPQVKDVDIVMSAAAAQVLCRNLSLENRADRGSERFRSAVLAWPDFGPVPVEIIGDFQIRSEAGWVSVAPTGWQEVALGGRAIHLATRARLAEIFRLCGRDRDLERAARLAAG